MLVLNAVHRSAGVRGLQSWAVIDSPQYLRFGAPALRRNRSKTCWKQAPIRLHRDAAGYSVLTDISRCVSGNSAHLSSPGEVRPRDSIEDLSSALTTEVKVATA
jgi:hypothetical protein